MWGCQKHNLMGMQKLGGKAAGDYGLERERESSIIRVPGSGFVNFDHVCIFYNRS